MAELARDHAAAHKLALCRSGHGAVTEAAYTAWKVQPMRFSSIFQPTPQPELRGEEPALETPQPAVTSPDLPDDLDARVRLVGEWQLFEG